MITEPQLRKHILVPESRHHMYLRVMPFNAALTSLGCIEDADAARLLGMKTPKTIKSARGGAAVSEEFMANTMAAFKLNAERLARHGIEVKLDLFFEEGTREEREPIAELVEVS